MPSIWTTISRMFIEHEFVWEFDVLVPVMSPAISGHDVFTVVAVGVDVYMSFMGVGVFVGVGVGVGVGVLVLGVAGRVMASPGSVGANLDNCLG